MFIRILSFIITLRLITFSLHCLLLIDHTLFFFSWCFIIYCVLTSSVLKVLSCYTFCIVFFAVYYYYRPYDISYHVLICSQWLSSWHSMFCISSVFSRMSSICSQLLIFFLVEEEQEVNFDRIYLCISVSESVKIVKSKGLYFLYRLNQSASTYFIY